MDYEANELSDQIANTNWDPAFKSEAKNELLRKFARLPSYELYELLVVSTPEKHVSILLQMSDLINHEKQ